MDERDMNRRHFSKLTAAAFGGLLAGAGVARAEEDKKTGKKSPLLYEPHICRGLNTCKGKGKGGKNACAGQSDCSTAEAHSCSGENACRGFGGCGNEPGENKCKGMSACHVPLTQKTWTKARKRFEELMAKEGKKVGAAPAPKKS